MPAVEKNAGTCYVWIITSFLFVCITAGGILLAIYMSEPDASSWYAIAGITLVCLPWFFWFLTFLYRVLSRRLGFRMACWGVPTDSLPRTSTTTNASAAASPAFARGGQSNDTGASATATLDSGTVSGSTSTTEGGRKVRFGGAVVVGDEHEGQMSHDGSESARSHESEAPLRYSMAS